MRTRLLHYWEAVTSGYWFVPTFMVAGAVAMAFALLFVDRAVIGGRVGYLYAGGSDGAKTLLSTVAGSVITVAGVVFSITIAALTQASSQFGPRLLRNFMRDTGNQVVLGTFVATYAYCLLVLRTIHGQVQDGKEFVPQASVTVAVLLAGASLVVLIYFIHHVSISLQAPRVVAAVRQDLESVIARIAGEQSGSGEAVNEGGGDGLPPAYADADAKTVAATTEGYLQAVDYDGLITLARTEDLVLRMACRPGEYVVEGCPLLQVWPGGRHDGSLDKRLNGMFHFGSDGTPEQDVEYALRQLVEVAVRALSPGINDPFTAINCVDALGSAVCRISRLGLPGPRRHDAEGRLRLVVPVTTFDGLTDTAFNQIRQYGRGSVAVTVRLLEVLRVCALQATSAAQMQALLRHGAMVFADSAEVIPQPRDREDVRLRWDALQSAAGGRAGKAAGL